VSLDDVLITPALAQRPSRPPDLGAEVDALGTLARYMAEQPDNLLEAMAATALRLCRGDSAGVSLLEPGPDGSPGFRWAAVAGVLACYADGRGPLHSPCGTCIERGGPQLYRQPGRHYGTAAVGPGHDVLELLVVPLPQGTGRPGTIWIVSHGERRFDAEDARIMTDLAAFTAAAALFQEVDRRRTEFWVTLAHELRNPLTPVRAGLTLLREMRGDEDAFERTAAMMERQVAQIAHLVDDLVDAGRAMRDGLSLVRGPLDLFQLVREVADSLGAAFASAGLSLMLELPVAPAPMDADRVRLAQALGNLLDNARKFTPPGGRVTIRAEFEGARVRVRVADTGEGISPGNLRAIFEPFFRGNTMAPGSGIGLALVRQLIELHGGTVTATSAGPGLGSEFVMTLPLDRTPAGGAPPAATARTDRRDILVVDDNRAAAQAMSEVLALEGHRVRTAFDGQRAVEEAEAFRPGVIIMDLWMPGVGGFEAAAAIRSRPWGANVVLVALTGWSQESDRLRATQVGFDHYLVKPVDPIALRAVLCAPTDT